MLLSKISGRRSRNFPSTPDLTAWRRFRHERALRVLARKWNWGSRYRGSGRLAHVERDFEFGSALVLGGSVRLAE